MSGADWRCDDCGQFLSQPKAWAAIYDMANRCCAYEHQRCWRCFEKLGPVHSNARPVNGDMSPYEGINELDQ